MVRLWVRILSSVSCFWVWLFRACIVLPYRLLTVLFVVSLWTRWWYSSSGKFCLSCCLISPLVFSKGLSEYFNAIIGCACSSSCMYSISVSLS